MNKSLMIIALCLAPVVTTTPVLAQAPSTAPVPKFSVETSTIGDLLDNPASRTVLDKHLPELGTNAQMEQARGITLKQLQQYAPQLVTAEVLAAVSADLAKIK